MEIHLCDERDGFRKRGERRLNLSLTADCSERQRATLHREIEKFLETKGHSVEWIPVI